MQILEMLPELEGDEMLYVQGLVKDLSPGQAQQFAAAYRARRRDPTTVLILTLIGFVGFAGIQRFYLNQVGMGLLYFLTAGICLIGTIVDLVNYRKLSFEYNQMRAQELATMVRASGV